MTTDTLPPAPGADEAVAMGCTCPVDDNAHGRGYRGQYGLYVYTVGCPVHIRRTTLPDDWKPEPDHRPHRKMPVSRLRAVCEPCFRDKFAWMGAQPRGSHARTSYERLCGIWEMEP